jgi:sugar lactone lactonase YvrE
MSLTTTVLADGFAFLEGPRWHDGKLWLSDMHDDRVLTIDAQGKSQTVVEIPGQPSGLGWTPDDRLLIVSMIDRRLLRLDPDGLQHVADLKDIATYHCNDMVVDARGRAYIGNFGWNFEEEGVKPVSAALALVMPDGATRVAAPDLRFPNGTVITPDGRTLIVGESFGGCLTAFDVADDGSLSNRREWAKVEGAIPDGICLDAENAIWVASPMSNEVVRVREGGEVTHRVPVGQMAIACMLGGDDRRTLFVLTAPTTTRAECRRARGARVETVRVEVPGAGLP